MTVTFNNNAKSTLAAAISDSAPTLYVAAGTGDLFPTLSGSDYFLCTIVASTGAMEIVKVTARTSDTFTIERGQEGTSPTAFSTGATIENRMTAGTFDTILESTAKAENLPTAVDGEFIGVYTTGSGYASSTPAEFRTAVGSGTVGDDVFIATTASEAQQAMDVEVGVDVQAYDADTAKLDVAQEWTASQNFNGSTLTDAATISWDLSTNQAATVTLGGDRTLDAPTNMNDGGEYQLVIKQDATGGRTLSFDSTYLFPGGTVPTITSSASAIDLMTCRSDGTNMYCVVVQNFS